MNIDFKSISKVGKVLALMAACGAIDAASHHATKRALESEGERMLREELDDAVKKLKAAKKEEARLLKRKMDLERSDILEKERAEKKAKKAKKK